MKNIIITESKLKKLWSKLLSEEVGVPKNILISSEKLYKELLDNISSLTSVEDNYEFEIKSNFKISDLKFEQINIDLEIKVLEGMSEPDTISMGFKLQSKIKEPKFNLEHQINDIVDLNILIGFPNEWDLTDLKNYIVEDRVDITSSLAHELKHFFDYRMKPEGSGIEMMKYKSYSETNIGIPPIDKFIFALYFTHSIENLVRPTQLASAVKSNNITQKEFYDFFVNSELFKTLKQIQTSSFENFIGEMFQYIPKIRKFLRDNANITDAMSMSEYEVIDVVMDMTYNSLSNNQASTMHGMLISSPLEMLLGFMGDKEEFFDKFLRDIRKYEDGSEFFESEFKFFERVSTKMIKKISKIYSLIPNINQTETNENKSIKHPDLYHKSKGHKKLFDI
jgi:hypothetical protein